MKPIIVLPVGTVSKEDIKLLNENDLCVIEAKNPVLVKFIDPIPCQSSRTEIEAAAIQLSRRLLRGDASNNFGDLKIGDVRRLFIECLVKGSPLADGPTQQEREAAFFSTEKHDELRRLAREEARAERKAAKEEAAKKKAQESEGKKKS